MSTKYKFIDSEGIYFVSFATVSWVDVFRRLRYMEIFIESIKYCQQDNHPIELFSTTVTFQKIDYVHKHPFVVGIVSEADHYLHSSSRDYSGIKGVLDVEILERPMSLEGYVFSY